MTISCVLIVGLEVEYHNVTEKAVFFHCLGAVTKHFNPSTTTKNLGLFPLVTVYWDEVSVPVNSHLQLILGPENSSKTVLAVFLILKAICFISQLSWT